MEENKCFGQILRKICKGDVVIKFLLCTFFFVVNINAAEIKLSSIDSSEVYRGDIVTFNVSTNLSIDEVKAYENKRIGDLLYVISVINTTEGIQLEAIVAEKGLKEKVEKTKDKFIISNLNFIPTEKKSIKDFILLDEEKYKNYDFYKLIGLIVLLFLIILSPKIVAIIKKKKKQKAKSKEWKRQQEQLLSKLEKVKSRNDLENVFKVKPLIQEFFYFDTKKLESFESVMQNIQYKKEWDDSEFERAMNTYKLLSSSIEVKRGV